ncbi:MAG TPA: hypothetical protein VGA84_04860 [Thermoanaerobaculia bacterium]
MPETRNGAGEDAKARSEKRRFPLFPSSRAAGFSWTAAVHPDHQRLTPLTASADTSATTTAPPAEKQNGNMNLLLAIVLILAGIGALVILFRASD